MMTPSAQARQDAGLSVPEAARRVRVSPAYLRRIEIHGDAPYVLAVRLANLYRCSANLFLYASTAPSKTINGPSRPAPTADRKSAPARRRNAKKKCPSGERSQPPPTKHTL